MNKKFDIATFEARYDEWPETPAGQLLEPANIKGTHSIRLAFARGDIDGSVASLEAIVDKRISVRNIGPLTRMCIRGLFSKKAIEG